MKSLKRIINNIRNEIVVSGLCLVCGSCQSMIEIEPPQNQYTASEVYSDDESAKVILTGIYSELSSEFNGSLYFSSYYPSMLSDELINGNPKNYFINATNIDAGIFWNQQYGVVLYRINSLIEGVSTSKYITENVRYKIIAEAKFLRAIIYFYLVNYFGGVPMVTTTDWKVNSKIRRSSISDVYKLIEEDLIYAQSFLNDEYTGKDLTSVVSERIRPNKRACSALLARVYLYEQKWSAAEEAASLQIEDPRYILPALNNVFLRESKEAILQFEPYSHQVEAGPNSPEGRLYVDGLYGFIPIGISEELYSSFEDVDQRKSEWLLSNNDIFKVNKYKKGRRNDVDRQDFALEYTMILRLAEQYLIRAEARAQQDKLELAKRDLNAVRIRAGLRDIDATTKDDILNAILHERRVEFFAEAGHRWFDLKRTGKIDEVMSIATQRKGGTWASYKALMPIPSDEFKTNSSLRGTQNPGYPESY